MAGSTSTPQDLLRGLTLPVALVVAIVVAAAWIVAWATSDLLMGFLGMSGMIEIGSLQLAVFFVIMIVMMVAMMLPSALPMIVAYHGLTRLEAGQPTKPADRAATASFVAPYFLVWGAFGVAALLGLITLGLMSPLPGTLLFVPAFVLASAGVYQFTRTKQVCLAHCQSPMSFVMLHWRSGRWGAFRMGLRHSMYCVGCCWLFMIALFVAGAMSLVWMGVLSLAIFAEKVGTRPRLTSRVIAVILIALGALAAVGAFALR